MKKDSKFPLPKEKMFCCKFAAESETTAADEPIIHVTTHLLFVAVFFKLFVCVTGL